MAPFTAQAAGVRPLLLAMEHGPGQYAALGLRQRLLATLGIPARRPSPATSPAAAAAGLSDRELTILRLLHGTLTGPEIAAALTVSPNTLKTHLRHIYRKLGSPVASRPSPAPATSASVNRPAPARHRQQPLLLQAVMNGHGAWCARGSGRS